MQNTPATSSTAPRIRQAVRTANAKTAPPALPRAPLLHGLNRAVLWQLAACGTGLLLSAGQVYGGAAPFGLGLLLGCGNTYAPAAALGCLAGLLLFQPLDTALKLAGACIGALTARIVGRQLGQTGFLPGAACGVGVLLLEQGLVTLVGGASPADTASLLCSAALAVLVGLGIHKLHIGTPRGACLWAAMAAACLQRAALPGFAPGLAGAAFCILCCACAGSLEHTAVLALVLAMALTAAAPALCFAALAVAAGGLGTAVFCPGERRSGAAVFAAGCALGALAAPNLTGVLTLGLAAGAGLLGFLLCPEQALRAVFPPPAPPVGTQSLTSAARKLSGVADTLSDIAETVNAVCSCQMPPRGESYDYVVEFCAQHLCQNCARRNTCWVQGYSTAMDGLYALRGALEQSCNCYFIALGQLLGGQAILNAAQSFGLGTPALLAPGLKSAAGELPSAADLQNAGSLASLSFGQGGLTVTPLQVTAMFNAIASGGVYHSPCIVSSITGGTQVPQQPQPAAACSPAVARVLQSMLATVVRSGIGGDAQPHTGTAAGKTGTAQTGQFDADGRELLHYWFAGFYPADAPRYTITVLQDSQQKPQTSSAALFAQVADALAVLDAAITEKPAENS